VDALDEVLARTIHERFRCNRGFAAVTSLDAVGTAYRQAGEIRQNWPSTNYQPK